MSPQKTSKKVEIPDREKCAFDCFRAWQEVSGENIVIKNEQNLIAAFEASLEKALTALVSDSEFSHKGVFQQGRNYGFILGFLSSNLGYKWHFDYVFPRTVEYQTIQSFKATLELLRFDKLISIKHEQLFLGLLKNESKNLDFSTLKMSNGLELLESHLEKLVDETLETIENKNVPNDVLKRYLGHDVLEGLIMEKTNND